jgi:Fibronectin type III domain
MINNSRIVSSFIIFILLNLVLGCSVTPTEKKDIPKRSITLAWDSPRTNADGTALNNLAGYRIYYGPSPGVYPQKIDIDDPSATEHTIKKLSPGTYYFVITAYSGSGLESEHSKEVTITIK